MNTKMHAVFALSSVPLFLGALLSDWAYSSSHQIQWVNFAAWLIAEGLLIAGPALLWGAVDVLRPSANHHRRSLIAVRVRRRVDTVHRGACDGG